MIHLFPPPPLSERLRFARGALHSRWSSEALPSDRLRKTATDLARGLAAPQRYFPTQYLYDRVGSVLFDAVTMADGYYLGRAETRIVQRHARGIATLCGRDTFVELGGGLSRKSEKILTAMAEGGRVKCFAALEISPSAMEDISRRFDVGYPRIRERCFWLGDFTHSEAFASVRDAPKSIFILGSTIGNLRPDERHAFFGNLSRSMLPGDRVVFGHDRTLDTRKLDAAYNDRGGRVAAFTSHALTRLNRVLGANFDPLGWRHEARFDEKNSWVDVSLRPVRATRVKLGKSGEELSFSTAQALQVAISTKLRPGQLANELSGQGFAPLQEWKDSSEAYVVSAFEKR